MPTKIEWCDETWNPITGCTPISEACENCYAKRLFRRNLWGYGFIPGTRHHERFSQPGKWRKPRRIFVCSMGDLFHDEVPFGFILDVMSVARTHSRHTYMFLTKREERMAQYVKEYERNSLPDNVWLGVSVENQKRWNERVHILRQIRAAVRFVSAEPLLGPIVPHPTDLQGLNSLDWVIAGPETGPGKRPCHERWLFNLIRECRTAEVPVFLKRHADGRPVSDGLALHQYPNGA